MPWITGLPRALVERGLLVASPEKTNQAIAGLGERTG